MLLCAPLEAKEKFEQPLQRCGVVDLAAQHLLAVLPEHKAGVVAEDDVVLRVAFSEFLGDLGVQIVVGVFRFPVAQRHAQLVQERTVERDVGLGGGFHRVFGKEYQALLAASDLDALTGIMASRCAANTPEAVGL